MSSEKPTIGWIGTGVMGLSMCGRLMDAGWSAVVHNRTRAKAEGLLERGATWADSPRAAAEQADVIFTMVGYPRGCPAGLSRGRRHHAGCEAR